MNSEGSGLQGIRCFWGKEKSEKEKMRYSPRSSLVITGPTTGQAIRMLSSPHSRVGSDFEVPAVYGCGYMMGEGVGFVWKMHGRFGGCSV
jgi:hypothetical protein